MPDGISRRETRRSPRRVRRRAPRGRTPWGASRGFLRARHACRSASATPTAAARRSTVPGHETAESTRQPSQPPACPARAFRGEARQRLWISQLRDTGVIFPAPPISASASALPHARSTGGLIDTTAAPGDLRAAPDDVEPTDRRQQRDPESPANGSAVTNSPVD